MMRRACTLHTGVKRRGKSRVTQCKIRALFVNDREQSLGGASLNSKQFYRTRLCDFFVSIVDSRLHTRTSHFELIAKTSAQLE